MAASPQPFEHHRCPLLAEWRQFGDSPPRGSIAALTNTALISDAVSLAMLELPSSPHIDVGEPHMLPSCGGRAPVGWVFLAPWCARHRGWIAGEVRAST